MGDIERFYKHKLDIGEFDLGINGDVKYEDVTNIQVSADHYRANEFFIIITHKYGSKAQVISQIDLGNFLNQEREDKINKILE